MEEPMEPPAFEVDRVCPICSDVAPNSEPHRIHYGARCCLGCRAFFRRIHQKETVPDYKCKSNNDCVITPKSKQLCKKCRYQKCLDVGMNPKQVLSDDERKQRFKNLFKKIEEKQRLRPQTAHPMSGHKNLPSASHCKRPSIVLQKPRKILPKDPSSISSSSGTFGNSALFPGKNGQGPNISFALVAFPGTCEMAVSHEVGTSSDLTDMPTSETGKKLSSILDSFIISMLRVESSIHTSEIVLHHLKTATLRKTSLILHLGHIASALTDFARSMPVFRNLSSNTQRLLLRNNVPLYIQYVLARYFNAASGLEQLNWILEGQLSVVSVDVISSLYSVDFADFNSKEYLLGLIEAEIGYTETGRIIHEQFPFPQHCNGLVAYLLLFNTDQTNPDEIEQDNLNLVCKEFETAKFLLCDTFTDFRWSTEKFQMLFSHLMAMKRIFDRCHIDSNLNNYNAIPESIVEKFSAAEDVWLQIKFRKFNESFSSVSMPQKLIFSIINYTQNKNSFCFKEMTPTCLAIITERVRRSQKIHPEFERLTDNFQETLWARNRISAIALTGLKVNLYQKGIDQLRFSMGYMDPNDPEWMRQIQGRADLDSLKVAHIYNNDLNCGRLDDKSIMFVKDLLEDLSHLLQRDDVYELLTILALLDTTGLPHCPALEPIVKLRQVMLKLFFRKVSSSQAEAIVDYFAFRRVLEKVQEFGSILLRTMSV